MPLYGQYGGKLKILRVATVEDFRHLEGVDPIEKDRLNIEAGLYVVIEFDGSAGRECMYPKSQIRIKGDPTEVDQTLQALKRPVQGQPSI